MINRKPVRRPEKATDCKPITLSSTEFISLKRKKLTIYRILYFIGGNISLAFGIIGIFLPGLPTTPFVLLAAALYAKSSPNSITGFSTINFSVPASAITEKNRA